MFPSAAELQEMFNTFSEMSVEEKAAFAEKLKVLGRTMSEKQQSQLSYQASLQMVDKEMILLGQPNLAPNWPGSRVQMGDKPTDGMIHQLDGSTRFFRDVWHKSLPNVTAFVSITCPIWRARLPELQMFRKRCLGRAHFIVVYTREAHTEDGWPVESNVPLGLSCNQPNSLQERLVLAKFCKDRFQDELEGWEFVVDNMEDTLSSAYDTLPIRLYIFDSFVRFQGGLGPFFFDIEHTEASLRAILRS